MNNDFVGNEFHKARRHDLVKEAEGSRLLKSAEGGRPSRSLGVVALKAIGALITVLFIAQLLAR